MVRKIREDFDRERDFVVRRNFTLQGQYLKAGQLVDKTVLTTRRLRLLYDQRMVTMGVGAPAEIIREPAKPITRLRRVGLKSRASA